jgi:putative transposase
MGSHAEFASALLRDRAGEPIELDGREEAMGRGERNAPHAASPRATVLTSRMAGKITAMHAQGRSPREIAVALSNQSNFEVGEQAVWALVNDRHLQTGNWLKRELDPHYAIIALGTLDFTVPEGGTSQANAMIVAVAVRFDGTKDVLGIWLAPRPCPPERCRAMVRELKARGLAAAMLFVSDNEDQLTAIKAQFPCAQVALSLGALTSGLNVSLCERREASTALRKLLLNGEDERAGELFRELIKGSLPFQSQILLSKLCTRFAECLSLSVGVRRVALMSEPIEAIAGKLRRRGAKLCTRFRSTNDALERVALMLEQASADWKVYPHQWSRARRDLSVLARQTAID